MGAGKSTSKPDAFTHENCNCDLWKKYKHCCRNQCLGVRKEQIEKALSTALKKYRAEYVTSVIMQYLPDQHLITEIQPTAKNRIASNSIVYAYTPIKPLLDTCKPPCSVWAQDHQEIKMVMLGNGGVGKSALTIRFITDNFLEEYDPTIEDSYRKAFVVADAAYLVDVLDTAGREEFGAWQDQWIREGSAFLICFAINSRDSWEQVENYRTRCLYSKEDQTDWGMLLVATKCDLEEQRVVSRDEILQKAKEWNMPFIETSAKQKINVDFVYQQAIYTYWVNSQSQCLSLDY